MPNVELLRRVLAHIEAHPEQWDQLSYRALVDCGTAYCFAGHVVGLTGGRWSAPIGAEDADDDDDELPPLEDCVDVGDVIQHVSYYAQNQLGITSGQADELFSPGNTLDDLRRIVGRICGDREAVDA